LLAETESAILASNDVQFSPFFLFQFNYLHDIRIQSNLASFNTFQPLLMGWLMG